MVWKEHVADGYDTLISDLLVTPIQQHTTASII
jgi:hypothetical protein